MRLKININFMHNILNSTHRNQFMSFDTMRTICRLLPSSIYSIDFRSKLTKQNNLENEIENSILYYCFILPTYYVLSMSTNFELSTFFNTVLHTRLDFGCYCEQNCRKKWKSVEEDQSESEKERMRKIEI